MSAVACERRVAMSLRSYAGCALVMFCVHGAQAGLIVSNVTQEMYADLNLEDQFGIDYATDGFSYLLNSPDNVNEARTASVDLYGVNDASATLNTSFGANALTGAATLTATYGNFPSNIIGDNISHVTVAFRIMVDAPTEVQYDFALGTAAGGNLFFGWDTLQFSGSDGTPDIWLDYAFDTYAASGTATLLPGVNYDLFATIDTGEFFMYLDNIDGLNSFNTAFTYSIVIPAPGAAALLAAFTLPRRRHR